MDMRTVQGGLPDRRWDIDWLRILVVVGMLVPFHTFRLFDTNDPFYVKNNPLSTALNWYLVVGDTIGMQLLFMLAGAAAWFSLRRASSSRFAWQRTKRLLVPLIFGLLVIAPPQLYYAARHHHAYEGSFPQWYPNFFYFDLEALGAYDGPGFSPVHLWFILYLLVISLVALPLLLLLRRSSARRVAGALAAASGLPGGIILMVIPLALAAYFLPDIDPNPLEYLVWFLAGYVMLCDPRFEQVIDRNKGVALVVGLGGLALWLLLDSGVLVAPAWMPGWLPELARNTLLSWLLVVALLGYARRYLAERPRGRALAFLGYFGEASYPFYILHQTVIVVLGYYLVQLPAGVGLKYVLIGALTYVVTIALYDVAVRRSNFTRFLFGMKPRPREEKPRVAVA